MNPSEGIRFFRWMEESEMRDSLAQRLAMAGWQARTETRVGPVGSGCRADIVAKRSESVVIVECKVSVGGPKELRRALSQLRRYVSRFDDPCARGILVAQRFGAQALKALGLIEAFEPRLLGGLEVSTVEQFEAAFSLSADPVPDMVPPRPGTGSIPCRP